MCSLLYKTNIGESLRSRGHSLNQGTWGSWILTLHLNYVAGYTGPLLFLAALRRLVVGACRQTISAFESLVLLRAPLTKFGWNPRTKCNLIKIGRRSDSPHQNLEFGKGIPSPRFGAGIGNALVFRSIDSFSVLLLSPPLLSISPFFHDQILSFFPSVSVHVSRVFICFYPFPSPKLGPKTRQTCISLSTLMCGYGYVEIYIFI